MKEIIIQFTNNGYLTQISDAGINLHKDDIKYFETLRNSVENLKGYLPLEVNAGIYFRIANTIISRLNSCYGCKIKKYTKSNYLHN